MLYSEVIEMGYTAHELAELSGVSIRTLHYYEEQGLLHPPRRPNGYRDYTDAEVRRLQHILLYRQAQMPLARIRTLLEATQSEQVATLQEQLAALRRQRDQMAALIATVEHMVQEAQGLHDATVERDGHTRDNAAKTMRVSLSPQTPRRPMSNKDMDTRRFTALKQQAIQENEQTYGAEIRKRYGDATVDAVNERVAGLTPDQWDGARELEGRIAEALANLAGSPCPEERLLGDEGRMLCELHRAWLLHHWTPQMYSPAAHKGLAQMYVADERFATYYNACAPDGATLLRDAIDVWADRL